MQSIEIDKIRSSVNIIDIIGGYIPLKKFGSEYKALCPFHDENTASFFVNETKQVYHCLGCGKSGDVFRFVMDYDRVAFLEAFHKISASIGKPIDKVTANTPAKNNDEYNICLPIPDDAPEPFKVIIIDDKYYPPNFVYSYLNANGELLKLVYRVNLPVGKEIRPLTYWIDRNGKGKWQFKDIPKDRPLYGLDLLAQFPNHKVLIVSGEKCVDAVKYWYGKQKIQPENWEYIPITWAGGDNGIGKHDFGPITHRDKTYWPDNDIGSKTCMQRLADKYDGCILNIETDKYPKGWDVADLVKDTGDIHDFINKNLKTKEYKDPTIPAPCSIFPHKDDKNKLISSIQNVQVLLDYYSYNVSFNEITLDIECKIKDSIFNEYNYYKSFSAQIKSMSNICKLPKSDLSDFLFCISMKNKTNPVKEWIHSEKWDGVERIKKVCDAVECASSLDNNFKNTLITKWLISCYAAIVRKDGDGFRARGVLVFQGKQDMGKTTFFRLLANDDRRWFGEGININPDDKDTIKKANKYWITELGELDRMTSTDKNLSSLKSFITNSSDELRLPYAEAEVTIWRRTIFCGTVNPEKFLHDMTGNSRFWCIPVVKINWINNIDIQQMWAEIRHIYETNKNKEFLWWLTLEETTMLAVTNSEYEHDDKLDDLLCSIFDMTECLMWQEQTITEILEKCGIPRQYQNQSDRTKAGIKLKKLFNIEPPKRTGYTARKWKVPPYKTE